MENNDADTLRLLENGGRERRRRRRRRKEEQKKSGGAANNNVELGEMIMRGIKGELGDYRRYGQTHPPSIPVAITYGWGRQVS